jgi:hypothetical protein
LMILSIAKVYSGPNYQRNEWNNDIHNRHAY